MTNSIKNIQPSTRAYGLAAFFYFLSWFLGESILFNVFAFASLLAGFFRSYKEIKFVQHQELQKYKWYRLVRVLGYVALYFFATGALFGGYLIGRSETQGGAVLGLFLMVCVILITRLVRIAFYYVIADGKKRST